VVLGVALGPDEPWLILPLTLCKTESKTECKTECKTESKTEAGLARMGVPLSGLVLMQAIVSPTEIDLSPGTLVRMPGSWQDYEALVARLGDRSLPRVRYRSGEIILMSPLPRHGREADSLADLAKELLDYQGQDYAAFTPITMTLPGLSGVEPDYCFYIANWRAIAGKDRIAWGLDPSPDLVIEVDVTSYTDVNDFVPYGVPEVWIWQHELLIYGLQRGAYELRSASLWFPSGDVPALAARYLRLAKEESSSVARRDLRRFLNGLF
jgi:Uma2 family endonuclease